MQWFNRDKLYFDVGKTDIVGIKLRPKLQKADLSDVLICEMESSLFCNQLPRTIMDQQFDFNYFNDKIVNKRYCLILLLRRLLTL